MTSYSAGASAVSTFGVKAATYQMRLARIDVCSASASTTVTDVIIYRYTAATFTGGSTITPIPLREGGPAAAATSKSGATISGTQLLLGRTVAGAGGGTISFTLPFDIIVAPGSALWVAVGAVVNSVVISFEELHLARSF